MRIILWNDEAEKENEPQLILFYNNNRTLFQFKVSPEKLFSEDKQCFNIFSSSMCEKSFYKKNRHATFPRVQRLCTQFKDYDQ